MTTINELNATLSADVKHHDHDRWLTVHYAPARARPSLISLLAFDMALARIAGAVREPMIGEVRLAWWRDQVGILWSGRAASGHPVLEALTTHAVSGSVPLALMEEMIEAYISDLYEARPKTMDNVLAHATATGGALTVAIGAVLIGEIPANDVAAKIRSVGTAYALMDAIHTLQPSTINTVSEIVALIERQLHTLTLERRYMPILQQMILVKDHLSRLHRHNYNINAIAIEDNTAIRQLKMIKAFLVGF